MDVWPHWSFFPGLGVLVNNTHRHRDTANPAPQREWLWGEPRTPGPSSFQCSWWKGCDAPRAMKGTGPRGQQAGPRQDGDPGDMLGHLQPWTRVLILRCMEAHGGPGEGGAWSRGAWNGGPDGLRPFPGGTAPTSLQGLPTLNAAALPRGRSPPDCSDVGSPEGRACVKLAWPGEWALNMGTRARAERRPAERGSLGLGFLICKMGQILPTSGDRGK